MFFTILKYVVCIGVVRIFMYGIEIEWSDIECMVRWHIEVVLWGECNMKCRVPAYEVRFNGILQAS